MLWQRVKHLVGISPPPPPPTCTRKPGPIPPCSDLYDLVLDLDWDRVIQHCQEHPQDAHFQEGDNLETPLYLACQWQTPLAVFQALIQANPQALEWTSREHRDLPLHMICRCATTTVDMLQEFVAHSPAGAVAPTKYGKTPLQVLWEFARPECLKTNRLPSNADERQQVTAFWAKMELLVAAVATSRQHAWPQHPPTKVLYQIHALVSLGSLGYPPPVLEYMCDRYQQQLSQRDETGQLPLHLAVGPTQWSGRRKYKPREQAIIQLLVRRYPEAARRLFYNRWVLNDHKRRFSLTGTVDRRRGRHPLHIALANRHTWEGGVKDLFHAAPEVLSLRDPVTRLYPFQLAAIPVQDHLQVDVGTIVDLLRQQPELLQVGTHPETGGEPSGEAAGEDSTMDVGMSPPIASPSTHQTSQESHSGVVVAIAAGLWAWTKHHWRHARPFVVEEEDR